MMSLGVEITLFDKLTRPAKEADRALSGIGLAAERLAARFAKLTGSIQGLTAATRELSGADAALSRATASSGRLKGMMTDVGPAARAAAGGLSAFSRAADRMTKSANNAADAAERLHAGLGRSIGESFVDRTNAGLREQIKLLGDATRMSKGAGNGDGGNGGRRGMLGGGGAHGGGIAIAYGSSGLTNVARKTLEVTISAEDAILRARLNGFTETQIAKIKKTAEKVANDNHGTTYAGNVKGLIEARLALAGDLDKAARLFPMAANFGVIFAKMSGETDKAEAATKNIYAAFRGAELRNIVGDDTRLSGLLRGMMASDIVSEGKIGPQQFASNIQYARSAGLALSDKFTNFTLPFLMQELQNAGKGSRGGQAGNALMSGYAAVVQGRIAHGQEWVDAGELDASDLDKKGKLKPGAKVKDQALYMDDPAAFFRKIMVNFESRGITSQNDKLAHLSKMFDNRVAAGLADLLSLQDSRVKAAGEMYVQAGGDTPGSEIAKLAAINATLGQSTDNLKNAYGDLLVTINGPFVGALTGATQGLNGLAKGAQGLLSRFTGIGSDPNDPSSTGPNVKHLALAAASFGLAATAFLARFPAVGVLLAQGFLAYTQGPLIAIFSRSTLKATADGISGALSTANAFGAMKSLGKGLVIGIVEQAAEWGIGKLVDKLRPAFASPERAARADKFNRQWFPQKFGLFGGSSDPMDPRFDPVPLAGHRAAGGPVRGRGTYLVGERGPELFTPGMSGGITNNTDFSKIMAGSGGDPSETSMGDLIRELRAMSFGIVSALQEIARSLGRSGRTARGGSGRGLLQNASFETDGEGGGSEGGRDDLPDGGVPSTLDSTSRPRGGRRGLLGRLQSGSGSGDSPKSGGGRGPSLEGPRLSVEKKAMMDQLRKEGVPEGNLNAAASALMGNVVQESGGDPNKVHDGGTGYGIYGARDNPHAKSQADLRRTNMLNWLKENNFAKNSAEGQARYMAHEAMSKQYASTGRLLRNATAENLRGTTIDVAKRFEGPKPSSANYQGRASNAQNAMNMRDQTRDIPRQEASLEPPTSDSPDFKRGQMDARAMTGQLRSLRTANEQCVSLATASVGLHAGMKGNNVHEWLKGAGADAGGLKPGTPIATFLDRAGRQVGRYAGGGSGTPGAQLDHAAVFEKYLTNKAGEKIGMQVAEQYKGSRGVHEKNYMFHRGWGEHNGSNYSAIKGQDGSYIGGRNNPMNDRVPEVMKAQADAHRQEREKAASRPDITASNDTHHHYHGDIATNVYAQPHHDARQIASLVHQKFDDSVRSQLNDGAYA